MEAARKIFEKSLMEVHFDFFDRNERAFTYECYRIVRNTAHDFNFEFSAEISKSKIVPTELKQNEFFQNNFYNNGREDGFFVRTPDFAFHNYDNNEHQLFAIEVKPIVTSDRLIRKDLSKLMFYCKSDLRFKKAILVLFGKENQNLSGSIVPNINEILKQFPEIEVWIARPNSFPIIYCSTNLIP